MERANLEWYQQWAVGTTPLGDLRVLMTTLVSSDSSDLRLSWGRHDIAWCWLYGLLLLLTGVTMTKTRTWTTDLEWNNLRLTLSEVKLSSKVYSNQFQVKIRTAWGLQKGDLWQVKKNNLNNGDSPQRVYTMAVWAGEGRSKACAHSSHKTVQQGGVLLCYTVHTYETET